MRDAIELEWAGIPSVAVIHEGLSGSANAMRRLSGMPEYPFVTVPYPHVPGVNWTPEEMRQIARELAPRVLERLTKP